MMVYEHLADGMVSGAAHSTANTVRPALQIIKTVPGQKRVSGAMLLERGDERYVFADCAMNIDPDSATLAEIAVQSADTAKLIGLDPVVAMLSFSTKGSAKGEMVSKVQDAVSLAHELAPTLKIDGELQFDAAFVPEVGERKAPGSQVAGHANVFVFPELQSANIGYKIAQRLGNFSATGPVLQGLAAPVNDLSRGASSDDVYRAGILTAAQANMKAE
jgi:phosphate acetyltransferase